MARFNQRSVIQAVTKLNTTQGAYSDDGAEYEKYLSDPTPSILPSRAMVEDNAVGDGHAYPKQGKPYYFSPITIPYGVALNTTMAHRIFRDWLGGAITNAAAVTGTITQSIAQKVPGAIPLLRNYINSLGGAQYLFGDAWVQSMSIQQSGSAEPKISAQIMNNGHFAKIGDTAIDLGDIDEPAAYLKYHGAKSRITFSDGATTYNFATDHTLIDMSFEGNQNVIVDQLPGDSFQDDTKQCQGAISNSFYIDVQSASVTCKVYMDASFAIFAKWLSNTLLTSIVLSYQTCELIGTTGTALYSLYEITIPQGEFNLAGDANQNFSAYTFNIKAVIGDASSGNLVTGRIRRLTAEVLT